MGNNVLINGILLGATFIYMSGDNFIFQGGTTLHHRSKIVKECLHDNFINYLDWQAQRPAMNPVKNLCIFVLLDL